MPHSGKSVCATKMPAVMAAMVAMNEMPMHHAGENASRSRLWLTTQNKSRKTALRFPTNRGDTI